MYSKTLSELAAEMPDNAIVVGEMERVLAYLLLLRDVDQEKLPAAIGEFIENIEARIEKLDEAGTARAWSAAWREAEPKELRSSPLPALRLEP